MSAIQTLLVVKRSK